MEEPDRRPRAKEARASSGAITWDELLAPPDAGHALLMRRSGLTGRRRPLARLQTFDDAGTLVTMSVWRRERFRRGRTLQLPARVELPPAGSLQAERQLPIARGGSNR